MSNILSRVFNETDLAAITEMARIKRSRLGAGYDKYIKRVAETLKDIYPRVGKLSESELEDVVAIVDVWGVESHSMMKQLKGTCTRCGWCCSQTSAIIVSFEDVERISRRLRQKRDELFVLDGEKWRIKRCHPCQWWNPRTGRCLIYNIRPYTCRIWPLAINEYGQNTLHTESECTYAVNVLAYKVIGALEISWK